MRILLTNDDGVHAPGIQALYKRLKRDHEVYVLAPLQERSTTGHTLTLDHPLRMVEIEENVYGCSGYPADCALLGMGHLLKDKKPDLVISGINRGANLGQDVYYSGTVAAAREATFRGARAIAVSLVVDFLKHAPPVDYYADAAEVVAQYVDRGIHSAITENHLININIPDLPIDQMRPPKDTSLGFRHYSETIEKREDFRGRDYYWIGGLYQGFNSELALSDCACVDQSHISVSLLNLLGNPPDKRETWHQFFTKG